MMGHPPKSTTPQTHHSKDANQPKDQDASSAFRFPKLSLRTGLTAQANIPYFGVGNDEWARDGPVGAF